VVGPQAANGNLFLVSPLDASRLCIADSCHIRHSTSNYYGSRTVREGRRGASTRYHKCFPRGIEDSLSFEGFLQCPEFIEVSE
jgi:hypothetical protein